jgi:cytochrome P450
MFPPDAQYAPLPVLVGRAVDMLVLHGAEHARLHELMESGWVSPEIRAVSRAMNEEIEGKIGELLVRRTPTLRVEERRVVAAVMMNLVRGVLSAVQGKGEPERSAIIEEFKRLGVMYLTSVLPAA